MQAINGLEVDAAGGVAPLDPAAWPRADLVAAAHGNGSKIHVPLHVVSKPVAAQLFASVNDTLFASIAARAATLVRDAGYDGLSLDIEGLKPESKAGYEAFVAACIAALRPLIAVPTVYALKLYHEKDFGAYNISHLAALTGTIFIMGYDMTWLGAAPGSGATMAGPNSPLDGLTRILDVAAAAGTPPSALILGLPFYGRLHTCDGTSPPPYGNCSTSQKNFQKKNITQMASWAAGAGCTSHYNAQVATPWFECAGGVSGGGTRQQGWYEDAASFKAKLDLAAARSLRGVGVWTEPGVDPTTPFGEAILDEFVHTLAAAAARGLRASR